MNIRPFPWGLIACPWLLFGAIASAQTGTGLTGKYYDTETFGTLKTTRTDASINFAFGTAIPAGTALTAATTYSVAWAGQIEPQHSELYTFTVTADDGARLWVDDQMIVCRTFYQAPGELRGQIRLKAGHRVNLRLEYIQQGGPGSVKLEWASASQPKQVVPTNRLYPTTEVPNGGSLMREVWTGLAGTSLTTLTSNANYPNKPASRDFLTSFECLARDWEDNFGTRVTGFIRVPVSGSYTFAVSGDEVVQLYLSTDATSTNKTLIASTTTATAFRDFSANASQQSTARTLIGGQRYYVELLHKESTGADHWSVGWRTPGDAAFSVIPGTALMMPGTDTAQPATANFFNTLATEQPRLGVSRERFLWLKQQYLSPTASNAKTRAQAVINTANGERTAAPLTQRQAQDRIQRLALAWWLTGDNQYAEAAWNNIDHAINNGSWTDPWKGVENGVIAIGYDWLYPYWSQARKDAMVSCMVNKGFNPGWTDSYGNNIGVIINAGHLMAMLAVGTVNEAAAENRMGTAISRLTSRIEKFNSNSGAWYEGTDYGIFTKWGLGQAMPSIECALGSTFGMSRVPGISNAAREPLTIASNTRQRFTFSDIGTGSEAAIGWANWWARRFNALETFDYSRQNGNSPLNALTLPEATISPTAAGLNPDTAYRGPVDSTNKLFQEVVTLRENWTDSKATFVGALGGTYQDHGHLQSGTFQLMARGVKWFQDLSSEDYSNPQNNNIRTNPTGLDRWDYYRYRAEGHNCLIVNPTSLPDRIWDAPPAPLISYQSAQNGQRSFAIWDLSNNITGVTRVQRGIQLLNKRREVLVQDEIVAPAGSTAWWFAHYTNTNTSAVISPDGTSVMLFKDAERLWCKIVSGGGTWTIRPAEPLPTSPNPATYGAQNGNNSSRSKISINLTNAANTTLAVWFVPLAPGEDPPVTTPTITALNTWSLIGSQSEPPVAQNSGVNSVGGGAVDVNLRLLAKDDWTPTEQLTFAVGAAVGGTVALQPDGFTARFTPTSGFTGAQSFTFTATDGDGAPSNTATISISATPVVTNWTSTTSGNWSTGTNWQGGSAPVSSPGADLQFFNGQTLAATTITATNDLPGTSNANKLTFSGTGTATTVVNVGGNPLRLLRNGAASPVINLTGITAGYRYNIANDIALEETVTINANNSGTFVFNGSITGSGGLTRTNTFSTLILAGNNSYGGPTTISAGTLQIGNDGATGSLGSGPVEIASGATLRFDRTGTLSVPNDIGGAGALSISGVAMSDVVALGGANTFTGGVTVSAGSLRVTDAGQLGDGTKTINLSGAAAALRLDGSGGDIELPTSFKFITSNPNGAIINEAGNNRIGGTVTLTSGAGNTRLTSLADTLTIEGNVAPNTTGRALDLRGAGNGVIHGNVLDGSATNTLTGLSKNEGGTWTLNGNNAFTGATTVSAGRLVINGSHASGNFTVSSGATLAGQGSLTAAASVTGTLAPGDGVGTMNFSSTLSFGSASKLQWELASNSLIADQAIATGALSVTSGAKIDVVLNRPGSTSNFMLSFWRSSRTWPVATGASLAGSFQLGTVTGDSAGNPVATYGSFSLQHNATGVSLVWTPLPGFPIIDEPLVTFLQPLANPVVLPNPESTLRIAATAAGGGSVTYAWSTVSIEEGGEGTVTFGNPAAADTTVSISDAGRYILRCTATNSAVSRSADLTVDVGPPEDGDFSNAVAVIDPGTPPPAAAGFLAHLAGTVSNSTSSAWSFVSGPGTVSFSNAANPASPVVFSQPGDYILRLTVTNALGQAWRELAVTVSPFPAGYDTWQAANWPGVTDPNIIGSGADPDGDGATNAAEFLAGTDPKSNGSVPSFVWTQTGTGNWNDPANWNPAVAPGSNALTKLEFLTGLTPGGNTTSQQDLGASFTLQRLALNGTGTGTSTLSGGTLAFATGGTIDLGNGGILYDLATPLNLTAATVVQGSPTAVTHISGGLAGAGSLTKNSTGTLEISGPHSLTGALNINAGTLRVSGAGTSSGAVTVRGSTLAVSGSGAIAPVVGASLSLGGSPVGIFNHDSSANSKFAAMNIGTGGTNNNGTLNHTNGVINGTSMTLGGGNSSGFGGTVAIGNASGNAAELNISGNVAVGGSGAYNSTITVKETGTLNVTGNLRLATATDRSATGTITQNTGSTVSAASLSLSTSFNHTSSSTHTSVYNLNGGTLRVGSITTGTPGAGAPPSVVMTMSNTFNFDGGTLKATASNASFWANSSYTTANVKNGGAKIDTTGFDITIGQSLLKFAGSTTDTLTKDGLGTLTLGGTNTYTGATSVNAGTLALVGGSQASPITVGGTASLGFTLGSPSVSSSTITLVSGSKIKITGTPVSPTSYTLITASAITGTPVLDTPIPGYALAVEGGNVLKLNPVAASGFAGWIGAFSGLADSTPVGDPDHDGMENLLEYVLNGNPGSSDPAILPDLDASGQNFVFTFTRREVSANDTTQVFEYGSDLGGWTPLNITAPTAGQIALGVPAGGLQTVTIIIPKALAGPGGKLFGRLRVSQP